MKRKSIIFALALGMVLLCSILPQRVSAETKGEISMNAAPSVVAEAASYAELDAALEYADVLLFSVDKEGAARFTDGTACSLKDLYVRCEEVVPAARVQTQEEADLNDNLVMTPSDGKLMRLSVTRAAAADGGYEPVTLTATVLPENATDKTVDWAVAFVNPSSEWASGKTVTDYVTVTPSSDGAATATVQCMEDFGAQIVVTATSRDNPEATAQCTVDFAKRIEDIKMYGHFFSMSGISVKTPDLVYNWQGDLNGYQNGIQRTNDYWFAIEYSDYTIDDFTDYRDGTVNMLSIYSGLEKDPNDDGVDFVLMGNVYMTTQSTAVSNLGNLISHNPTALATWIAQNGDEDGYVCLISFAATLEGEYSSYSFEVPIRFQASSFTVAANDVTLDESNIII